MPQENIKWLTHTVGHFFQPVCTLKFQAYGHGNSYQYSKAIEEAGDIQERASAVKQSSKSNGLTHALQTVCRLSPSLNGAKSKVADASGDQHCSEAAQEAFSDSCNTDYIVWRPVKGENDESSHAGHTQCTNGSGQKEERGGAPGV